MPKVRCGVCKQYVDREGVYYRNGIESVCSESCLAQKRTKKVAKMPARPEKQVPVKRKPDRRELRGDISADMRLEILARDHYRCRWCGTNRDTHIHHIVYRSQGGPGENWNLITLCNVHHALVHSNKKVYKPLCLGVIWMTYAGHHVSIPGMMHWIETQKKLNPQRWQSFDVMQNVNEPQQIS